MNTMKVSSKYGDRKSLENVDNISNKKRKQNVLLYQECSVKMLEKTHALQHYS